MIFKPVVIKINKCYICKKKIKPGSSYDHIAVNMRTTRPVHPGCKENAKRNQRKQKGVSA